MAKKHKPKNPGIKWPKTKAAQLKELQHQSNAVAAVATMGQVLTAAQAVPNPRARKMLADAAAAAVATPVGGHAKTKKGEKRSWQKHADQYFSDNKAWDEVNGIYLACVDLLRTSLALVPLLKEQELLSHVRNVNLLARNVSAINRDTLALAKELAKIKEGHKDKEGGSKSQPEMMESCAIFSDYVNFMERYDSALMPLVVHASEQLQEALIELQHVNPELAAELNQKLQENLNSIRTIVHEVTGAEAVETPTEAAPQAEEVAA
ncbi:hypothetical protein [Ralstonia phage RP31]|uniref:Uncharacterized protein n=2 Tax=Ripduovirus RP12 TaxID=2560700 RepID=A0A1L7N180_9CAUD|nr:hypothetical protein FDH28_gp165 [Ralstonia phage RP12]BAW19230.1 hypothetical protein [Ralstonia phage RP12]BAW19516.1 hypothetical protein [Ralstonia phage RP31]